MYALNASGQRTPELGNDRFVVDAKIERLAYDQAKERLPADRVEPSSHFCRFQELAQPVEGFFSGQRLVDANRAELFKLTDIVLIVAFTGCQIDHVRTCAEALG